MPGGSPGRRGLRALPGSGGPPATPGAKPLKGELRGLVEVIADHTSGTYRAIYTAKLAHAIYVLHVFQKKSTSGIAMQRHVVRLIQARLKWAEQYDGMTTTD